MPTITLNTPMLQSLLAYAAVVQSRDSCTHGHMWRVSQYAACLTEKAGCPTHEVFIASLGGMVHDIGKIAVPDAILRKPGRLKYDELALMRQHPRVGQLLVQNHPLSPVIGSAILDHHERMDGDGYPRHRRGEQLSIYARVVAIADAFDAMTSPRVYRRIKSIDEACEILNREKGSQFDPELTDIFLEMVINRKLDHVVGHAMEGQKMAACSDCGLVIAVTSAARSGDNVICPECGKRYRLHALSGGFELEWMGNYGKSDMRAEIDAIREFIRRAPSKLKYNGTVFPIRR